jgi:hypothetical protein
MNNEELKGWLIVIFNVELYKVSSYNMDGRVNLTFFVLRELSKFSRSLKANADLRSLGNKPLNCSSTVPYIMS